MAQFALHTEVKHYIERGTYHLDTVKKGKIRKRSVRAASKDFIVKDGQLYYKGKNGTNRLVVMNMKQKEAVLRDSHENTDTGRHQSQRTTYSQIIASYYWVGIGEDVNKWIARCARCKLMNTTETDTPGLHTVKVTKPWSILGLDLTGPFPTSLQGNTYILTMTDVCTKWVIAEPLKSNSAAEASEVIINKLFDFGLAESIITGQERDFVDQVNEGVFKVFGVRRCVTSAVHPQSAIQLKRTNQIIQRTLSKYCNGEQSDWDQHLRGVVYAINTSTRGSMKNTPYFLLFKRHPLTSDRLNPVPESQDDRCVMDSPELGTESRMTEVSVLRAKVLYTIEKEQGKRKAFSEICKRQKKKMKSFDIHEGDLVLLANKRHEEPKCRRLQRNWSGPYFVRKITRNGLVTLADKSGKVLTHKKSVSLLKPYLKRDSELNAETNSGDHYYCMKTSTVEVDEEQCMFTASPAEGDHTNAEMMLSPINSQISPDHSVYLF